MKLSRKNVGRIATTFLATAMLASLTAVPAMAATGVWGDGDGNTAITSENTIELSKVLTKRAGVTTPNVKFKVNVDSTLPLHETIDNIVVQSGPEDSVAPATGDDTFTFAYDASDNVADTTVQPELDAENDQTVTIRFDLSKFVEPGIYKYAVTETIVNDNGEPATYEGITNDEAFMYVYVEENGQDETGKMTYRIANVVLTREDTVHGKIANLTNRYGVDPENNPDGSVNDVYLTKQVDGNQASTTEKFDFTITIDPSEEGNTFRVAYGSFNEEGVWVDGNSQVISMNDDGVCTTTVELAHGEYVRIYGLTANDEYTITEADYSNEGYTTKVAGYTEMPEISDDPTFSQGEIKNSITAKNNDDKDDLVVFTNYREASTPTGIVMNVAPYALLVVIAAAGCFVFLRKRDED